MASRISRSGACFEDAVDGALHVAGHDVDVPLLADREQGGVERQAVQIQVAGPFQGDGEIFSCASRRQLADILGGRAVQSRTGGLIGDHAAGWWMAASGPAVAPATPAGITASSKLHTSAERAQQPRSDAGRRRTSLATLRRIMCPP